MYCCHKIMNPGHFLRHFSTAPRQNKGNFGLSKKARRRRVHHVIKRGEEKFNCFCSSESWLFIGNEKIVLFPVFLHLSLSLTNSLYLPILLFLFISLSSNNCLFTHYCWDMVLVRPRPRTSLCELHFYITFDKPPLYNLRYRYRTNSKKPILPMVSW